MRLTTKKIEEILLGLLGEDSLPLVRLLIDRANVSEFDLANKTKKDIKIIRKMLYLLYNYNLVGFTRKKDKQKGWYIYYWTLLPDSIKFNYYKSKKELLERLKQQLKQEEKELFFICPNNCIRLDFDQSIDFEFHCPECGELITQDDSKRKLEELREKILNVEQELEQFKEQRTLRRKRIKERKKDIRARKLSVSKDIKIKQLKKHITTRKAVKPNKK